LKILHTLDLIVAKVKVPQDVQVVLQEENHHEDNTRHSCVKTNLYHALIESLDLVKGALQKDEARPSLRLDKVGGIEFAIGLDEAPVVAVLDELTHQVAHLPHCAFDNDHF